MRSTFLLLPLLALAACTVGPNYAGPKSAGVAAPGAPFVRADAAATTAPQVSQWWKQLGDPLLDTLEDKALAADPDIAVAEARLKQARSTLRQERANQLPSAKAQALYVHAKLPGVDLGSSDEASTDTLNLYNLGFDASWEVDLWGGNRRRVEAARAQIGAAEANRADAQVSLAAEVAQSYVELRDRQQRIGLLQASVARQHEMLKLVQQRAGRGASSAIDLEQQRDALEKAEAALLPVTAERDAYLNALATLTGEAPGALDGMLGTPASIPLPPADVAVGDPAALVQRRPDIRAAERQLAKATAQVGVAQAARFPTVSLTGMLGFGGTNPGDVVDPDKLFALAMPQISWSFLDFGRTAAKVDQAKGAREEAEARYNQTVLDALRDCEDALSRFGAQRRTLASSLRSQGSANRNEALIRQRFRAGSASRIQMLQAEDNSVAADRTVSQEKAAVTRDFIALQKALGLGWQ